MPKITLGGKNPVDVARERLRSQEATKVSNSYFKTQAKNLELFDTVVEEVRKYKFSAPPAVPTPKRPSGSRRKKTMVLLYSDGHCGLKVETKNLGGLGGFNINVWKERHDILRDAVIEAQEDFKADELAVFDLGDVMEGQDIFKGQTFHIDLTVPAQIVHSGNRVAEDTHAFASHFSKVRRYISYGNHGRKGQYGENPYEVNYEYVVYKMAEGLTERAKNVEWHHGSSWYQVVDIHGTSFLLLHGDTIKSYGSNLAAGMRKLKTEYVQMLNMPLDYLVAGHHHQQLADDECLANGSLVGASEFTARQLASVKMPSQKLFLVEEGSGITWKKDIALAKRSDMRNIPVLGR